MAMAVGASADELREANRDDAAKVLAHLTQHGAEKREPVEAVPDEELIGQIIDLAQELQRRISTDSAPAGRPPLHLVARQIDDGDSSTFERDD